MTNCETCEAARAMTDMLLIGLAYEGELARIYTLLGAQAAMIDTALSVRGRSRRGAHVEALEQVRKSIATTLAEVNVSDIRFFEDRRPTDA